MYVFANCVKSLSAHLRYGSSPTHLLTTARHLSLSNVKVYAYLTQNKKRNFYRKPFKSNVEILMRALQQTGLIITGM